MFSLLVCPQSAFKRQKRAKHPNCSLLSLLRVAALSKATARGSAGAFESSGEHSDGAANGSLGDCGQGGADAADGSEDEGGSADDSNGRTGADGEEDFDEGDALHDEGDEEDDEDGVSDGAVGARDHQAQSGAFNNLVPGFLTNVSRLAVRRSSRKRNRSARSVLSTCSRQSAPAPVRDLSFVKQLTVFVAEPS